MMLSDSDSHFRDFAHTLERAIERYGDLSDETLLARQCRQMEKLASLEVEFTQTLLKHAWGPGVFKGFVGYICDERKNILAARPFFRERQVTFTREISKALKARNHEALYGFHINFQFVQFAVNKYKWPVGSQVLKIAKHISQLRMELVEMNMPLAISRARIFWSRTPKSQLTYMDLVQISCDGLISAIDKYVMPFSRNFRAVIIGRITGNFIEQYSIDQDTILKLCDGSSEKIKDFRPGDMVWGVDNRGHRIPTKVVALHDHGTMDAFEVRFDDGYAIVCSCNHKFLTPEGMAPLGDIVLQQTEVVCESSTQGRWLESPMRDSVRLSEGPFPAQAQVPGLQGHHEIGSLRVERQGQGSGKETRRLAGLVRGDLRYTQEALQSQEDMYCVSRKYQGKSSADGSQMERGTSREDCRSLCHCQGSIPENEDGRPFVGSRAQSQVGSCHIGMGKDPSHRIHGQHEEGVVCSQAVKDGGVVEIHWYVDVGRSSDSLRRRAQASGLCFSGPQDLGGSGRGIPFLQDARETQSGECPAKGCDVESGSTSPARCDAYSIIGEVLHRWRSTKARVASMAYAHAPLASIGGLVLRRVVSVRYVGQRHMYDLEVSHPKHNFLLPNGIVTSNSETLVHFFPVDKRKIYRANKLMSRLVHGCEGHLDYAKLVEAVNKDVDEAHKTTESEIADLLAAASCVSTDGACLDGEDTAPSINRFAAPSSCQPDVQFERHEVISKLEEAIRKLPMAEQKLLHMKGISLG